MARNNRYSLNYNDTITAKLQREESVYLYNQHILNNAYKSENIDESGSGDDEDVDSNKNNANPIEDTNKNENSEENKLSNNSDQSKNINKNEDDIEHNETFPEEIKPDSDQVIDRKKVDDDFKSDIFLQASQTSTDEQNISDMTEKTMATTDSSTPNDSEFNSKHQFENHNHTIVEVDDPENTISRKAEDNDDQINHLDENSTDSVRDIFSHGSQNSTENVHDISDMTEKAFTNIDSSTPYDSELDSKHQFKGHEHQTANKNEDTDHENNLSREAENQINNLDESSTDFLHSSTTKGFDLTDLDKNQFENDVQNITDKNENGDNFTDAQSRQSESSNGQVINSNTNSSNLDNDLFQQSRQNSTENIQLNITTSNFSKSLDSLPNEFQNNTFIDTKMFSNLSVTNITDNWLFSNEDIEKNSSLNTDIEFTNPKNIPLIVQPEDTIDDTDMETTMNSDFKFIEEVTIPDSHINELELDESSTNNSNQIDLIFTSVKPVFDILKSTTLSSNMFKNEISSSSSEINSFEAPTTPVPIFESSSNNILIEGKGLSPEFENIPIDSHINKKELEEEAWSKNGDELFKKPEAGWSNHSVPMKQTFKPSNLISFDCKRYHSVSTMMISY